LSGKDKLINRKIFYKGSVTLRSVWYVIDEKKFTILPKDNFKLLMKKNKRFYFSLRSHTRRIKRTKMLSIHWQQRTHVWFRNWFKILKVLFILILTSEKTW